MPPSLKLVESALDHLRIAIVDFQEAEARYPEWKERFGILGAECQAIADRARFTLDEASGKGKR